MIFQGFLKQSTAVTVTILMIDSTDHITGKTGLQAGLTFYQSKAGAATGAIVPTSVTEIDATNAKGLYAVALNTTSWTNTLGEMILHVTGAGADPADFKWWISARLPDDLAYPATTGRSMVVDAAGLVDANVVKLGPTGSGTAQTARDVGASVLLSTGTGTGQLDFTSGVVKANLVQILATTLTETAGQIAAGFKKLFNVAAPTAQADNLPLNTDYTAGRAAKLDNLDATVSSRLASASISLAAGAVTVGTNNDKTAYLLSAGTGAGQLDFTSGVVKANLAQILGTALTETAGQIAAGFKKLFNVATPTAQADNLPLNTDYTSGRAAKLDNLDATVSSRLASASISLAAGAVTVGTNNDKTGYALTAGERNSVADALLARNIAGGSSTGRIVKDVMAISRNKVVISGGVLTVYDTDDTSVLWTAVVTTAAGNPLASVDPA